MMRCLPRKARHQWVFFLLVVCLLGVYLAYRKLLESEKEPILRDFGPSDDRVERLQQQLKERVQNVNDLKMPQPPSQLKNYHSNHKPVDSNIDKTNVDQHDVLPDLHAERVLGNEGVAQHDIFPDFHAGRVLENEDDYVTNDEKLARVRLLLLTLSPTNWKTTLDPDEMILLAKSELMDLGMTSKLSCQEIDNMKTGYGQQQAIYGKKTIDYARQNYNRDFVLKSVGRDTQLKIDCLKMDYRHDRCQLMGNYRLVKELVLFNILQHPAIIKIEGFCLRGETIDPRVRMKGAIIVTESGKQIQHDMFQLLPWSSKLDIGSQLMNLLIYLENSPIGSLGFDKLQIQDFVMLKSDMKLVDLDNLMVGEIACSHAEDCKIEEMPSKVIQCMNKVCKGRNSQRNLYLLHQSLLVKLLKYSPDGRSEEVRQFKESVQQLRFTPREVLNWFEKQRNKGSHLVPDVPIHQLDNRIDPPPDRAGKKRAENDLPGNDGEFNQQEGSDNANKGAYYDRQGNANFPELWVEISATTCSYISTNGVRRYVYCMQTCCEYTKNESFADICCAYDPRESEFYIGAGMTALILIGALALFFAQLCCKRRNQQPLQNTLPISPRTRIRRDDILPTISLQVQPVQPPPYEEFALPGLPDEHGNTVNKQHMQSYPNEPPPAYTPCDNLNSMSV